MLHLIFWEAHWHLPVVFFLVLKDWSVTEKNLADIQRQFEQI